MNLPATAAEGAAASGGGDASAEKQKKKEKKAPAGGSHEGEKKKIGKARELANEPVASTAFSVLSGGVILAMVSASVRSVDSHTHATPSAQRPRPEPEAEPADGGDDDEAEAGEAAAATEQDGVQRSTFGEGGEKYELKTSGIMSDSTFTSLPLSAQTLQAGFLVTPPATQKPPVVPPLAARARLCARTAHLNPPLS